MYLNDVFFRNSITTSTTGKKCSEGFLENMTIIFDDYGFLKSMSATGIYTKHAPKFFYDLT
jgi:hypothetical protein